MPSIIKALKAAQPLAVIKFDEGCNGAVRVNNATICEAKEESPADGGNVANLKKSQGERV